LSKEKNEREINSLKNELAEKERKMKSTLDEIFRQVKKKIFFFLNIS